MNRALLLLSLTFGLTALAAEPDAKPDRPKLLVNAISPGGGIDEKIAVAMTDAVATEISRRGFFSVMSANDVQSLIGLERQKQLVGCSEETSTCLSELAGAAGIRFVVNGTLTRLGDAYQLTLQTLDSQKAQPLGRATRIAKDLEALQATVPWAVAEATATPLPPPPSRVVPYTLIGVGAAALLGGGVTGFFALSQETAVKTELSRGQTNSAALGTWDEYKQQANTIGTLKNVSVGLLGVGALAAGVGIWLLPADAAQSGGASAMLVPSSTGAALVGSF